MIDLAITSGKVSVRMMENSAFSLKADLSVVTVADIAVSKFIRKGLAKFLKSPDHCLIDEEDKDSQKYFDKGFLNQKKYIWATDPIDGTRNFSNKIPFYGVSIGLLKDQRPWLGVVYLPVLDELFYCDGKNSYFVQAATSKRPKKTKIKPIDQQITRQSVFFGSDAFFKDFEWDFSLCQIMLPSCAVVDLCYPSIGRGSGCFFNASLWDFAGAWPVFRSAGLDLRSLKTGKVLDRIEPGLFLPKGTKPWRIRDLFILSSARNFKILRGAIKAK